MSGGSLLKDVRRFATVCDPVARAWWPGVRFDPAPAYCRQPATERKRENIMDAMRDAYEWRERLRELGILDDVENFIVALLTDVDDGEDEFCQECSGG